MQADLIAMIPCRCTLGEGVVWDHRLGLFLWTDIEGRALHSYALSAGEHRVVPLGRRLGSIALTEDTGTLLGAFDDRIAFLDRITGETRDRLLPDLPPGTRFNDGKTAPDGSFWVGTMVEDHSAAGGPDAGLLYRYTADGALEPQCSGISISNGLAWPPGASLPYFADSPRQTVWRLDEGDGMGEIFATTDGAAYPDGAATSSDGCYWSALWGGGRVAVFSPDGTAAGDVPVPVSQPSCCAFGGPDLSVLAVTTARQGLSDTRLAAEPDAGNLYLYETDACGLPSVPFAAATG